MTQMKLASPTTINEPRHDHHATSAAIITGLIAFPNRENECVMPWAKPRLLAGIQLASARVAVGNAEPSPTPSRSRAISSDIAPSTYPSITVAADQIAPQINSVRRGPSLSASQPPTI